MKLPEGIGLSKMTEQAVKHKDSHKAEKLGEMQTAWAVEGSRSVDHCHCGESTSQLPLSGACHVPCSVHALNLPEGTTRR